MSIGAWLTALRPEARDGSFAGPRVVGVVALASLATVGMGCSGNPQTQSGPDPANVQDQFGQALQYRKQGNVKRATSALQSVWARCGSKPLGRQAFLVLAVTRLDPRYRGGSPDSVAAWAAQQLAREDGAAWLRAVSESLYLIARDLGGSLGGRNDSSAPAIRSTRSTDCDGQWTGGDTAGKARDVLPALPGRSLRGRLRDLQVAVDSLDAEVQRLRKLLKGSSNH